MLELGVDGPPDAIRAGDYYERAVQLGELNACHWGGLINEQGRSEPGGAPKNLVKALHFYRVGCDKGSPECCSDESAMYAAGKGVRKDRKRAAALMRRAEKLGFVSPD
jgi:TPR repeat protein